MKKIRLIVGFALLASTVVLVTVLNSLSTTVAQTTESIAQLNLDNLTQIAAVASAPNPLPRQKNRSSGNFNVQTIPSYANALLWEVYENGSPNLNIRFDVKADRSVRSDPWLGYLRHGAITNFSPYSNHRSIYIANPTGARGNFGVA